MKSKLITAALLAIAGFAIADLVRAALFSGAATLAVANPPKAMVTPPTEITGRETLATAAPPQATADMPKAPVDAASTSTAVSTSTTAAANPKQRYIVIEPGADLVVIETDTAPAQSETQAAVIPASIGEAAANYTTAHESSAASGDLAAPRVSNAAPAAPDLVIDPAVVGSESQN